MIPETYDDLGTVELQGQLQVARRRKADALAQAKRENQKECEITRVLLGRNAPLIAPEESH